MVLPSGIGDWLYDIYGFTASNQKTLLAHDWAGGAVFAFGGSGVSRFSVAGIEISAGLHPSSATAFVTGLSLESAGVDQVIEVADRQRGHAESHWQLSSIQPSGSLKYEVHVSCYSTRTALIADGTARLHHETASCGFGNL